jgi:hypothetical protein
VQPSKVCASGPSLGCGGGGALVITHAGNVRVILRFRDRQDAARRMCRQTPISRVHSPTSAIFGSQSISPSFFCGAHAEQSAMGPPGISGLYFLSHSLAVLFVLWPRPTTTTDPGARARRFIVSGERTRSS